jgi:S-adenosylmethionine synthetase
MAKISYHFTSESVSEGHPDKIADQISDAILDALLAKDPDSRVAVETIVTTGLAFVAGEVTTKATEVLAGLDTIVRGVIRDIGYDRAKYGYDCETLSVQTAVHGQSPDIAMGVDTGGAGDQGIMFGFACTETPELMPLPITLAHKLAQKVTALRKSGELPYLRPDSKSQVTVLYEDGKPVHVDTVVISTQHSADVSQEQIRKDMIEKAIKAVIPAGMLSGNVTYHINPTGKFVVGGPMGDTGLTGRKIIVDSYGGVGSHGGGCFSGKDPSKVDRSGAYVCRYIAKNLVAAGVADRLEVQLAYAIGVAEPVSIFIDEEGTGRIPHDKIVEIVRKNFDLTPAGIIKMLDLKRPIYRKTAAYGHFGRELPEFHWEKTDKAEAIRKQANL